MSMARIKISCPKRPSFYTEIPVLIGAVNYGGHLGNDAVLSIMHEARMRFLNALGCSEKEAFGAGLIMADAAIAYRSEGFYRDVLSVGVVAYDIGGVGFDLFYELSCKRDNEEVIIAQAKTGMVCFDYQKRKTMRIPDKLKNALEKEELI